MPAEMITGLVMFIGFAAPAAIFLLWRRAKRHALATRDLANIYRSSRGTMGTKRLVRSVVAKRKCSECGAPVDMGDGVFLTLYEDGSVGCPSHSEEQKETR